MKFQGYDFTPHQPYLEYNTVYYSYKPAPEDDLYGIVWEVYQVDSFDPTKTIAFPDVCADIMVFYAKGNAHCYFMAGTPGLRTMNDLDFIDQVHTIFGVKFCSGSLGNLFCSGAPGDLFSFGACDTGADTINVCLEDNALRGSEATISTLLQAATFTNRWEIIRKYLVKRRESDYEVDPLVSYVARSIILNHGNMKINDLESDTGYSSRYLRKKLNTGIGVSLKTFCEIVRFQWSYHLYQQTHGSLSLAELALQSGYYDQSHMNMSYKKLTGMLPQSAIRLYA